MRFIGAGIDLIDNKRRIPMHTLDLYSYPRFHTAPKTKICRSFLLFGLKGLNSATHLT